MCDTMVATAEATAVGLTIFGKNSDREPNEGHHLMHVPAADHEADSQLQCTYVTIPQVRHTYEVLLAKPFWIWGAEMGTNEHGLTIGNEAVFTKVPYVKGDALIGMDLLRLALERAKTAREGIQVMTDLLAEHGQGGNCGFAHKMYYHNGYILADTAEAWVFETAGQQWAAKQIQGVYTISNGITLGNEWDMASPDLVNYAVDKGWCKGRDDFHFARCYSDFVYTRFSACKDRCQRTTHLLEVEVGNITPETVMRTLRDHNGRLPQQGLTGATVCMHAGFGPVRGSQTTGSMVSVLHPDRPTHFVTGTSAPCTSIFKPIWHDVDVPDIGPEPTGVYDESTLFWRHERLHRLTLADYERNIKQYAAERDEMEAAFVAKGLACAQDTAINRAAFSATCFAEADEAEEKWLAKLNAQDNGRRGSWLYSRAWNNFNKQAELTS